MPTYQSFIKTLQGTRQVIQLLRVSGGNNTVTAHVKLFSAEVSKGGDIHYALWDVIENVNSFKRAAQTTTNAEGSSTTLIPGPVTADEKTQKKNDVKARMLQAQSLDSIFYRIQKINKPDLDIMSFDDLYNNFKIVKQEVKGTASSSSSSSSQNLAFMSSTSSTNEVNTAYGVSTANTQVSTASTQVSTANLMMTLFKHLLASQPKGSQLVHEDLE
ncbi:hypothetical protein Tco_1228983 [Tanacetum coccineum]